MDFERDIAKISGIAAVSTILDVVSRDHRHGVYGRCPRHRGQVDHMCLA
ncbi:hypothetical protein ACVWXM_006050 [Bradyrhizobium sp. GM7.3]